MYFEPLYRLVQESGQTDTPSPSYGPFTVLGGPQWGFGRGLGNFRPKCEKMNFFKKVQNHPKTTLAPI
jgi:hypothetical protein